MDRSGLFGVSYHADRTRWFPSLYVVIRDNYAEDTGDDSLVSQAIDGALVKHSVATGEL